MPRRRRSPVNVLICAFRTDAERHEEYKDWLESVLLEQPNATVVTPGPRHWEIFAALCRESKATGNLVQDAWLAAVAIESGCEWITTDRDYARFAGLAWRAPF